MVNNNADVWVRDSTPVEPKVVVKDCNSKKMCIRDSGKESMKPYIQDKAQRNIYQFLGWYDKNGVQRLSLIHISVLSGSSGRSKNDG